MSTKLEVSLLVDDFILDKDKPYWSCILSNGETVYQDDERHGPEDRAWLRLKDYCKENNLTVEKVYIRFRSHVELALTNTGDGIFHRRKALGSPLDKTRYYYLFGVVKGDKIDVAHWRVPEVILEESDERDIEEDHKEFIIWNRNISPDSLAKKQSLASS